MIDVGLDSTPSGRRITVGRVVESPASVAWELLADTQYWPEWGPPVTGVDPPASVIEEGLTGTIQPFRTVWLPFRIERCEPRRWTWSVGGFSPPADGHRVESLGPDRCRIVLELPLWAPWYIPLCGRALANLATLASRHRPSESGCAAPPNE